MAVKGGIGSRKLHRCDNCAREAFTLFPFAHGARNLWLCGDCLPSRRVECDIGVGGKVDAWESPGMGMPDTRQEHSE